MVRITYRPLCVTTAVQCRIFIVFLAVSSKISTAYPSASAHLRTPHPHPIPSLRSSAVRSNRPRSRSTAPSFPKATSGSRSKPKFGRDITNTAASSSNGAYDAAGDGDGVSMADKSLDSAIDCILRDDFEGDSFAEWSLRIDLVAVWTVTQVRRSAFCPPILEAMCVVRQICCFSRYCGSAATSTYAA